jgi:hypothetical protein
MSIGAARVEGDKLRADTLALGQDARQHGWKRRERRFVDRLEIDRASHRKAVPRLASASRIRASAVGKGKRAAAQTAIRGPGRSNIKLAARAFCQAKSNSKTGTLRLRSPRCAALDL